MAVPPHDTTVSSRPQAVRRWRGGERSDALDQVAVESALEVRLHGEPFSVIMRTPGRDADLAAGFLFSEGILSAPSDLVRIDQLTGSVVGVHLSPARAEQLPLWLGSRRQVAMNSSCGMCGRRSLESLDLDLPPLAVNWQVSAAVVAGLADSLRAAQPTFDVTGGLHAAGLCRLDGTLEASAEDVGRHNAVDKLVGAMVVSGRVPLSTSILVVSGRSSFEIVQKAWLAGVPCVASVSAPSSLAVDLAHVAGMTLIGFVRDSGFNVYSGSARCA